jgi:uncharacterized protein YndB with AHSA1/START domain
MNNEPVIVERTYNVSSEKIWKAITDKDEMKKWYFDLKEFKPEVGFEFSFLGGDDSKKYLHHCRITEVIKERKLSHTWSYDGFEGVSEVTFELFPEGDSTKLKLTHKGLENFPSDIPDFDKKNFVAGWNHIIGVSLKEYLEKK